MRVALISDIHGNRWALEAVLDHIARQHVDATWNLGDILSGPLEPAATADLLIPLDLPTVAGNHDRQLLACVERTGPASDQFAFDRTAPYHHEWLRGIPLTMTPAPGIVMCHGKPTSDLVPLLESIEGKEQRAATLEEVRERLGTTVADLVVCGHSHVARLVRTAAGGWIVNPGSVGLQAYSSSATNAAGEVVRYSVDNGSPHASYAIAEQRDEDWWFGFHRVAYDWDAAAACAVRNQWLDWAHALRTGFAWRG